MQTLSHAVRGPLPQRPLACLPGLPAYAPLLHELSATLLGPISMTFYVAPLPWDTTSLFSLPTCILLGLKTSHLLPTRHTIPAAELPLPSQPGSHRFLCLPTPRRASITQAHRGAVRLGSAEQDGTQGKGWAVEPRGNSRVDGWGLATSGERARLHDCAHRCSEADPQFTMLEETASLPQREHWAGFMPACCA